MTKKTSRKRAVKHTLLQRFGLFFYDHFKTTLVLWSLLLIAGILCYAVLLKREGFPAVSPPISTITGTYLVNDSGKVDQDIAVPIQNYLKSRTDIKRVSSSSNPNFYVLTIEYKDGIDASRASADIAGAIRQQKIIPDTATAEHKPFIFGLTDEGDDLLVALYSLNPTSQTDIIAKADEAAVYLQNHPSLKNKLERVRVVPQYRSGIDPVSGQQKNVVSGFDRVAVGSPQPTVYPSVTIAVAARAETSDLDLYDHMNIALQELSRENSFSGFQTLITADYAEGIREQTGSLQENLLGGLVAVIVVSFLLISLRASFVTALSMFSVLAITISALYFFGQTLNTVTLFALILCLGLIVDDTTIMVEALDASRKRNTSRREIVATAIRRVARASTAGTFTTILAFVPLMFVSGIIGKFIIAIPITIIISLATSLLISLSFIPFMSRFLIKERRNKAIHKLSYSPLGKLESRASEFIAGLLRIGLRSRKILSTFGIVAITVSLLFTIAGAYLFSRLSFNIFPPTKDSNGILVSIKTVPGSDIQTAETITDEVLRLSTDILSGDAQRASLYSSGSDAGATIMYDLVSYKKRERTSPQIVSALENSLAAYQKAQVSVSQVDVGPPPGLFGAKIYYEESHRESAERLANDIRMYINDRKLTRNDGSTATMNRSRIAQPLAISRVDGKSFVEVQAEFSARDVSTLVSLAQKDVESEFNSSRIASYGLQGSALQFDFGAESDNQASFRTMVYAFPVLLVIMYVMLAFQFRSMVQPFLIFMAIPFSVFGIAAGLRFTNNPVSFFTLIGLFALVGISVNNTILLTDYANQMRKEGSARIEAISQAIRERFRPLITTSLTSIVALIPLAVSDPFWESLSVTLIFGLLTSTILVVFAFPYYYLAVELLRSKFRWYLVIVWLGACVTTALVVRLRPLLGGYMLTLLLIIPVAWAVYRRLLNRLMP